MMNKCASIAGHFNGYGGALEGYRQHCLMRHVQGYYGSHWTPASGNYSLHSLDGGGPKLHEKPWAATIGQVLCPITWWGHGYDGFFYVEKVMG